MSPPNRKRQPKEPKEPKVIYMKPAPGYEDDDSMGATFRAWRSHMKDVRQKNLNAAQELVKGFDWCKHTEYHFSTILANARLDYWPSRNKWRWNNKTFFGNHSHLQSFMHNRTTNEELDRG